MSDGLGEKLQAMADRYRQIVETLGGANADFNHTGFDFEKNMPRTTDAGASRTRQLA